MIILDVIGPTLIALGVIAAVWYLLRHRSPAVEGGVIVRWFFQYGLLLALLIIVGVGVSGLLALVIPGDPVMARAGPPVLARRLSFVIVGGPTLFAVVRWVRRTLDSPGERTSPAWTLYLNAASLVGLFVAAGSAGDLSLAILGVEDFDPDSPARLAVWGSVWLIHYRIAERQEHRGHLRLGVLVGALTGLLVLTGGLVSGLAHLLRAIYETAAGPPLVSDLADELLQALVGAVIGGAIWTRYWLGAGLNLGRDVLWNGYVVLVGVLGGLASALTAAGLLIASALDWFLGEGADRAAVPLRRDARLAGPADRLGCGVGVPPHSRPVGTPHSAQRSRPGSRLRRRRGRPDRLGERRGGGYRGRHPGSSPFGDSPPRGSFHVGERAGPPGGGPTRLVALLVGGAAPQGGRARVRGPVDHPAGVPDRPVRSRRDRGAGRPVEPHVRTTHRRAGRRTGDFHPLRHPDTGSG